MPLPRPSSVARYTVTAYCPCARCCGRWANAPMASRRTASGAKLAELIASGRPFCAAPRGIPFGAMIDVPGYGSAKVLDRGGAIKGRRIDVFFPTHDAALRWGRRELDVTVWATEPQRAETADHRPQASDVRQEASAPRPAEPLPEACGLKTGDCPE